MYVRIPKTKHAPMTPLATARTSIAMLAASCGSGGEDGGGDVGGIIGGGCGGDEGGEGGN